ncbi:MAG: uracil-DNA glycosylase [Acidobacteria bacterium]|nr:uracil-DNA glycosylase [Acidobacteriota bacterium]
MDELKAHLDFFAELGVDGMRAEPSWRSRPSDLASQAKAQPQSQLESQPQPDSEPSWQPGQPGQPGQAGQEVRVYASAADALVGAREDLGDCTRCKLHGLGRQTIVFGVGSPDADLMFVGEAPGADEDKQGEPFVGRAGQLLTKIIEAIDLRRQDVYIANLIKCRPPGNRNPESDEMEQCEPFLLRQIDAIQPKVIVALGKFAAQSLLRTTDPITRIRGREYRYRDAILVPTYHPAYLLRQPSAKRDVWADMKRVRAILSGE